MSISIPYTNHSLHQDIETPKIKTHSQELHDKAFLKHILQKVNHDITHIPSVLHSISRDYVRLTHHISTPLREFLGKHFRFKHIRLSKVAFYFFMEVSKVYPMELVEEKEYTAFCSLTGVSHRYKAFLIERFLYCT